ncbi:MAG: hypothetical protein QJR03_09910 [Sphaerobacter sp.]|nr:hypothetical protein [Sphaerobacter sp.]
MFRAQATERLSARGRERLPFLLGSAVARAALAGAGPPDAHGWTQVVLPIESVEHALVDLLRLGRTSRWWRRRPCDGGWRRRCGRWRAATIGIPVRQNLPHPTTGRTRAASRSTDRVLGSTLAGRQVLYKCTYTWYTRNGCTYACRDR